MRILVAGGAGFIGSHLCDYLIAQGHSVTAVDNCITGRPKNVAHLAANNRFSLLERDVTEAFTWQGDAVFHLASPASPEGYLRHPFETLRVNSVGTDVLLALAREEWREIPLCVNFRGLRRSPSASTDRDVLG